MSADLRVSVAIEPEDLVQQMHRDDLTDLFKAVDKAMQDWDFTLELAAHFDKLHDDFHAESSESEAAFCDVCNRRKK